MDPDDFECLLDEAWETAEVPSGWPGEWDDWGSASDETRGGSADAARGGSAGPARGGSADAARGGSADAARGVGGATESVADEAERLRLAYAAASRARGSNSREARRLNASYHRARRRAEGYKSTPCGLSRYSSNHRARRDRAAWLAAQAEAARARRATRRVPPSEQRLRSGRRYAVHAACLAAARAGELSAAQLAALDEAYGRPATGTALADAAAEWAAARGRRPPPPAAPGPAEVGELRIVELEACYAVWGRPERRGPFTLLEVWMRSPGARWAPAVRELLRRVDPDRRHLDRG